MQNRKLFLGLGFVVFFCLSAWLGTKPTLELFSESIPQPTQAPPPTLSTGSEEPVLFPTTEPYRYIGTVKEALEMTLYNDSQFARWEKPWSLNSLETEPGRITVEEFASRTEESAEAGRNEWFQPEIDADAGGVWRITIMGNVKLALIGMGADPEAVSDGVTYVISKRTGYLLATISGNQVR